MKKQTLAAITLAALTLITISACNWFSNKPKTPPVSLTGKWQIERIADSSKAVKNDLSALLIAAMTNDSAQTGIVFTKDSMVYFYDNKGNTFDTTRYYTDSALTQLFIQEDSSNTALSIHNLTDSAVQLYLPKDSIWYFLKKAK